MKLTNCGRPSFLQQMFKAGVGARTLICLLYSVFFINYIMCNFSNWLKSVDTHVVVSVSVPKAVLKLNTH